MHRKEIKTSEASPFTSDDAQRRIAVSVNGANRPWYDPELLYVECNVCGKPILWEPGRTTALLLEAGVDLSLLDERCLIVSEGCPLCQPDEEHGFTLAVVRMAGLTPEEAMHMARPAGSA